MEGGEAPLSFLSIIFLTPFFSLAENSDYGGVAIGKILLIKGRFLRKKL
jgi:hypothetical protein